jgi:DEAD/DEAH box helicase domain-containing protein
MAPFPDWLHPVAAQALQARGILELYSHQAEAAELLHAASTACCDLDRVGQVARLPPAGARRAAARWARCARALPVPDQGAGARPDGGPREAAAGDGAQDLTVAVYDGDTPPPVRQALREHGTLVLTNPHMLHAGILPNHTKWQGLFTGPALRRRRRTAHAVGHLRLARRQRAAAAAAHLRHYGSNPVFCGASATISNAGEHGKRLFERRCASSTRTAARAAASTTCS